MLISRAWGDLSKFINLATLVRAVWTHENTDLGKEVRAREGKATFPLDLDHLGKTKGAAPGTRSPHGWLADQDRN